MKYEVIYTDDALQDLEGIYDYISQVLREPSIAEKQTTRIMNSADTLDTMPFSHRLCDYEPWRSKGFVFYL
jgi:plasmid stabilization system protein ParE